jgi:hypothetical protein
MAMDIDTDETQEPSDEPSDAGMGMAAALIEVAKIRYEAFRERFGRDPEPDEPLLFDPSEDCPTAANSSDRVLQVVSAAMLSNVDADMVLDYLGFGYAH